MERILDLRKKRTRWKNRTTRPKNVAFYFISCHIKDRIEVIHFRMKSRGVQGLIFVQITFEKGITNFYFNNGVVAIKMATANLQPLLAWNVSACLSIFMQCFFDKKCVYMKLTTLFNLSTRRVLAKLLVVPKSSIKIKVRLHGTLFLILVILAVREIWLENSTTVSFFNHISRGFLLTNRSFIWTRFFNRKLCFLK